MTTYDAMRHFADSWGLIGMTILFLAFAAWPFRRSARRSNEEAANMIFKEDEHV